jgi:alpha-L-fucosidase
VRRLAPNTLVNSRVAKQPANGLEATLSRPALGDFGTPEQKVPERGLKGVDWESCITMNGNWGYNRADKNFKSVGELVGILTNTASKGGNLLLNVGPMGDGAVPDESIDRLQGMARWMKIHGDAIHGTTASPFEGLPFKVTTGARRLNCFLPIWPQGREVVLPALMTLPRARMLGDPARTPLAARRVDGGVVVTLPEMPSDPVCSVLALEFDGTPAIAAP